MLKLLITDDDGKVMVLPVTRSEYAFGRAPDAPVRLTERTVSRRHARLFRDETGQWHIEDWDSRNGVFVDDERVETRSPVALEQRIAIGDYRISLSDKPYALPWGELVDPRKKKGVGKVTGHARLVFLNGPTAGQEVALTDELYIIGRGERANILIEDQSISRAHARIEGKGAVWVLSDLDSANGIFVNGQRRDDYRLRAGDVIWLGRIRCRFVAPGEPFDYATAARAKRLEEDDELASRSMARWATGVAVVLVTMLGVWLFLVYQRHRETGQVEAAAAQPQLSFRDLVQQGQRYMDQGRWEAAARVFAQAQGLRRDSVRAKRLKMRATAEMEAAAALRAAKQAVKQKDWETAYVQLASIPPDSRYYDPALRKTVGARYCDALLYQAEFMITAEDPAVARVFERIAEISDAPRACLDRRDDLAELWRLSQAAAHEGGTPPRRRGTGQAEAVPGDSGAADGDVPTSPPDPTGLP